MFRPIHLFTILSISFGAFTGHADPLDLAKCRLGALTDATPLAAYDEADRLFPIVNELRDTIPGENDAQAQRNLYTHLLEAVKKNEPVRMVLVGFPFKAPNPRTRVLGELPDLAEELAVKRLADLSNQVAKIYSPGADFVIASDGRAYVWPEKEPMTDEGVTSYLDEMKRLAAKYSPHLHVVSLENFYPSGTPFSQMRNELLSHYARSDEALMNAVKTDPERNRTFGGLTRFFAFDRIKRTGQSNHAFKRENQELALEDMKRSEAFAKLVAEKYPDYIRFSVHPHPESTEKLGTKNLVTGQTGPGTPWYNVAVQKKDGTVVLMKRKEAEDLGYRLVERNGRPYYFEEPKN